MCRGLVDCVWILGKSANCSSLKSVGINATTQILLKKIQQIYCNFLSRKKKKHYGLKKAKYLCFAIPDFKILLQQGKKDKIMY